MIYGIFQGKQTDQMHQKFSIRTFAMGLLPYSCQLILVFLLAPKNTSTVALKF